MKKNTIPTRARVRDPLKLATGAVTSAKRFLESDTPAATATKLLLALAVLAPIMCVGAMAPNVLQLLKPYAKKRSYSGREASYALQVLDRSKYLSIRRLQNGNAELRITKKGMRQARKLCLETIKLPALPVWDGKWHLLFYDIPVKFNAARMAFRDMADDLGMFPLQKSVWIYPYACEAEILFVADFFGVAEYINFAVADALFDEEVLLKFFELQKRASNAE